MNSNDLIRFYKDFTKVLLRNEESQESLAIRSLAGWLAGQLPIYLAGQLPDYQEFIKIPNRNCLSS